jgi:hypothetical protein
MKSKLAFALLLVVLLVSAHSSLASTNTEALGRKAVSENLSESGPAIAELRAMGPEGLNSLLTLYGNEIARHIANPQEHATPEWQRLSAALDVVSQQKDSYLSGLYWYTDLTQAEAAAHASGKPILSLRLLGKLSEEFSCANSRFFRTVLYSNAEVSRTLREHFILHWQSVRSVPRVTIDFGDGRKLERTLTGNSIHYVLDAEGHIIDALPGLYGPEAFQRSLVQAEEVTHRIKGMSQGAATQALVEYHQTALRATTASWIDDATRAGGKVPERLLARTTVKDAEPRAIDIAALAMTKGITEFSILSATTRDADALSAVMDEATWIGIASRHAGDARLDQQSIGLIRRQMQALWEADKTNPAEATPEMKLKKLLQKLEQSIALDTVRNEYMLHVKLHAWLVIGLGRSTVDAFNDKVYAELFLTPKWDQWLGLYSDDTYMALESGGVAR